MTYAIIMICLLFGIIAFTLYNHVNKHKERLRKACREIAQVREKSELDNILKKYDNSAKQLAYFGQEEAVALYEDSLQIKSMSLNKPVFSDTFF